MYWHGSYGLGQMVILGEIATALAPSQVSWIGFKCDLLDRTEVAHLQAEIGFEDSAFSINLIPVDLAPEDEEPLLETAVRSLSGAPCCVPSSPSWRGTPSAPPRWKLTCPGCRRSPAWLRPSSSSPASTLAPRPKPSRRVTTL